MSRSGYSDDCDGWALIRWRGAVKSAMYGKRGQALLHEALAALDAMPVKRLGAESLVTAEGEYCTLGVIGAARGMDLTGIDPDDRSTVAQEFGVAEALAAEIMFENDERASDDWMYVEAVICGPMRRGWPDYGQHKRTIRVANPLSGEKRWGRMRAWVASNIKTAAA